MATGSDPPRERPAAPDELARAEALAAEGRTVEAVSVAGGPSAARGEAALALGHGHLALSLARAALAGPRGARDPAAWRCLVAAALWLDQGPAAAEALTAVDAPWALPLRVRLEAAAGRDPRALIDDRAPAAARREAEAHAALAGGWLRAAADGLGAPPDGPLPLDRDALGRALLAAARRDAAILRRLEPRGLEPAARRARAARLARAALEQARPSGATAAAARACLDDLARPLARARRPARFTVDALLRACKKRVRRVTSRGVGQDLVLRWAAEKDPLNPRAAFARALASGAMGELDAALRVDPRLHGTDLPTFGKSLRGMHEVTSAVLARRDLGLFVEEFEPPLPARTAARAVALEAALRDDPGDVLAIGALALLDLRLGRSALARERMAAAAEAEPTWSALKLYEAIACLLAAPPDRPAAVAALKEARRLLWPQVDASVYPELAPILR